MDVFVFEPATGGHHLHYIRVLTEGLLDLGVNVHWGLAAGAAKTPEYAVHLQFLAPRVSSIHDVRVKRDASFRAWKEVADQLIQLTAKLRPSRVTLPYSGGIPAALGSRPRPWPFPSIPLEGLVMRGGWAYPQPSRRAKLKSRLNLMLMGRVPWDRLHILDPLAYESLRRFGFRRLDRCRLIPEPVEPIQSVPPPEARARLGLPTDGRWLVVTGMQDARKGSDRLLQAFARAKLPDDARLLLAGQASDAIRQWVGGPGRSLTAAGRLYLIDRYLADHEHDLALNAADYMVAPHVRPIGSSGLIVRAAALGKPILAGSYGWNGWVTTTFGLGSVLDLEDPAAYAAAISQLFEHPPDIGNAHTAAFVQYHTQSNQLAHWLDRTRQAIGVRSDDALQMWPDLAWVDRTL